MKHKYNPRNISNGDSICNGYLITTVDNDKSKIPCFHIIDDETYGLKYDCIIRIDTDSYIKGDKLTKTLKKHFLKKLSYRSYNPFHKCHNVVFWKMLFHSWNCGNSNKIIIKHRRPRYENLQTTN